MIEPKIVTEKVSRWTRRECARVAFRATANEGDDFESNIENTNARIQTYVRNSLFLICRVPAGAIVFETSSSCSYF